MVSREFDVEHDVAEPERTGAETGDRAAGFEWLGGGFRAVENLKPVADRVGEHDQIPHPAFVGERAGAARDFDFVSLQMRGERFERRGVGHFPAEERNPFAAVGIDQDALLAVVHSEGKA